MCHVELMREIFCIFREFTGEERGNDDGAPKFKISIRVKNRERLTGRGKTAHALPCRLQGCGTRLSARPLPANQRNRAVSAA